MALLLILMALFGLVFGGFGSSTGDSSSPQTFRPSPGTTHVQKSTRVQKSVTRTHVTVRAHATASSHATATSHATAKSSVSCSASVKIKGASTQTSRTCRYSPVAP